MAKMSLNNSTFIVIFVAKKWIPKKYENAPPSLNYANVAIS